MPAADKDHSRGVYENKRQDILGNAQPQGVETGLHGIGTGDARRGQSLVVWAISEGREAGRCVDQFLSGRSDLPSKGSGDLPRVP